MLGMNIDEHPIQRAIYDLCLELEKLPASEEQTKVVVMAGNLSQPVSKLVTALKDALSVYQENDLTIRVNEERLEAWRDALGCEKGQR
jgi:hypothetical protein